MTLSSVVYLTAFWTSTLCLCLHVEDQVCMSEHCPGPQVMQQSAGSLAMEQITAVITAGM